MAFVAKFKSIKSGLKTTAGIKPYELAKYNSLFNQFKALSMFGLTNADKGQLDWIAKNWNEIITYIKSTYIPPKFTPSTLRGYLEAIANLLLAYDKLKFRPLVRELYNTGLSLQQRIDKESENSELTEQEKKNFVPYEDLVAKRDQVRAKWDKDPKNLKLNMINLILSVNTMIPPLRLDWVGMEIYPPRLVEGKARTVNIPGEPPHDKINYLWQYAPRLWAICLNYDKIQNKREKSGKERQIIKLVDEIPGVSNGTELNNIINISLEFYPRDYVLLGTKTKDVMGVSGYDSALGEMFKPKKPRQNLLRKSYVNFWYRKELSRCSESDRR
jgi:hypothetical protein